MPTFRYLVTAYVNIDADTEPHAREALAYLRSDLEERGCDDILETTLMNSNSTERGVDWTELVGEDNLLRCGRCGELKLEDEVTDCYECSEKTGEGCDKHDSVTFCTETCFGAHVDQFHPTYGEN